MKVLLLSILVCPLFNACTIPGLKIAVMNWQQEQSKKIANEYAESLANPPGEFTATEEVKETPQEISQN